jgi:hypothetical protein
MKSLEQAEVARYVLDLLCGTPERSGLVSSRESRRIHRAALPWLRSQTFRGIGVARRCVNGEERSELAIVLYVSRKVPRGALGHAAAPASIRVPGFADAIPVDVRAIGEVRAASGVVAGGSGISRDGGETGTLTCLVRGRDDDKTYLMSAGHVLAWTSRKPAVVGDAILSPPFVDGGREATDTIARYARCVRLDELGGNLGDAAIALSDGDAVSPAILGAQGITGVASSIAVDAVVNLTGATSTQGVSGRVIDPHFRTSFTYVESDGTPRKFPFVDQVFCSAFTQGGDSGAAVFDEQKRLVGIHLGITTGSSLPGDLQAGSVFSPIQPMLDALRVDPIFDPQAYHPPSLEPFPTPAPTTANPPPTGAGGPWKDFDSAVDVMARTVWGEAEGEGERGMKAVAWVIKNRALRSNGMGWGTTIEDVCTWRAQFDCWNKRRERMMTLQWQTNPEKMALSVAQGVLMDQIPDELGGARWFHTVSMVPPDWTARLTYAGTIGNHVFYR